MTEEVSHSRSTGKQLVVCGLGILGLMAVVGWYRWANALPVGVTNEEYHRAEQLFLQQFGRRANDADVFAVLGERAVLEQRPEKALACFRRIPTDHPQQGLSARLQEAQILARMHRAIDAERLLKEYLTQADRDSDIPSQHRVTAYSWLTYLLSIELRFEERQEVLKELHRLGLADVYDSKQFHFPHQLLWHSEKGRGPLSKFLEHAPQNPQLLLAQGRYWTLEGRLDDAEILLSRLHQEQPHDLSRVAALLECYHEGNRRESFDDLVDSLPDWQTGEPWLLMRMRGEDALQKHHWDSAVTAFQRLLEVDPANPWAHMGLAKAYDELGREAKRDKMRQRSLRLAHIRANMGRVNEKSPQASNELANSAAEIGLDAAAKTFRGHSERIAAKILTSQSTDSERTLTQPTQQTILE